MFLGMQMPCDTDFYRSTIQVYRLSTNYLVLIGVLLGLAVMVSTMRGVVTGNHDGQVGIGNVIRLRRTNVCWGMKDHLYCRWAINCVYPTVEGLN